MKKYQIGMVLLVVLALALSACNVPQAATQPSNNPQQTQQQNQQQQNQPTQPPQPTATTAVSLPEILNLQTSLDNTDSYRITFGMRTVGKTEDGQDHDESFEMSQEIIRSKNASRVTWKSVGASDNQVFTIINLGDSAYMDMSGSGEGGCFSYPATDAANQFDSLSANNFVGGISPDQLIARGENVNGLLTDHYSIKEAVLLGLSEEITSVKGDVWVTPDGKYTVRYMYEAQGTFTGLNTGGKITGAITMTYDLTDINQVSEITIPPACLEQQQQMADLPMMADATQVSNMSGMISYNSASDINAVKDFYLTQGVAQGWAVSDENSMEGFVSFNITKGDVVYNVMISPDSGGSGSLVLLMKQE